VGIVENYRRAVDRRMDDWESRDDTSAPVPAQRVPLTANQHILHLLLSVFTCGLWLPVWFVRAWRGNPAPTELR
jgi:hypothetical protein